MNHKMRETIEQYSMLEQGDTVIAAVSGGADSVALLDLLCMTPILRLQVRACHVNHCLRGEESDRDELLVRTMCREYGVPLDVRRVEILPLSKERKTSIEQTARDERYAFFEELAVAHDAKVATAHTLSDTAETVVFNMARGTGMAGLCGIPCARGRIIRPLITCTRAEVEAYCWAHGLYFVNDSTNQSDEYTRNFIRHNVMPALTQINGGALEAIGRMTELMRMDAHYMSGQAAVAAAQCATDEGGCDVAQLRALHPALRSRVLMRLLEREGLECSARRITQLEQLLRGEGRAFSVARGAYAKVRGGVLQIERTEKKADMRKPRKYSKQHLNRRSVPLGNGKILTFTLINYEEYKNFEENIDMGLKYVADYDRIKSDVLVRARQAGDRIRQPGRGCSKTLKKLLCEMAIPDRDTLCVVSDSAGVVFCESIGVDERASPTDGTKKLVVFKIAKEQTT